jgi:RNA polymerase sigma-70 factor, ECF subfamily
MNCPSIVRNLSANHSDAFDHTEVIATVWREGLMFEDKQLPDFEGTVLPHLDAAYNLARWLMRNEQDAQDAVQDAYLRALRFFPNYRGGNARAWLLQIVRNTCRTWFHANRRLKDASEFDENHFPPDSHALDPEEAALQNDSSNLVRSALAQIPRKSREVLILRELEEMSYKEIADITCRPPGTVMSSLSRARGQLRQVLTSLMNGETVPDSRRTAAVN